MGLRGWVTYLDPASIISVSVEGEEGWHTESQGLIPDPQTILFVQ